MKNEKSNRLVINTRSRLYYVAPLEQFWSSYGFLFESNCKPYSQEIYQVPLSHTLQSRCHQNKSSCQSILSLIVSTTVVFALIRFMGGSTSSSLGLLNSKTSSSVSCTPLPPYTATLFVHVPFPDSGSRLKLRSCVLLLLLHVEIIRLEELNSGSCLDFGLLAPPHTTRTKSGRSEGRQADSTAIEGSAAVQIHVGTKSSVATLIRVRSFRERKQRATHK